jgi:hypothetical protein
MPETLVKFTAGGIDTRSASIDAPQGSCANMVNWEKDQKGGLVTRLGWCRYDGRIQGPEIEDGVVVLHDLAHLTGTFQYGEQVVAAAAGHPSIQLIFIGESVPIVGVTASYASCFAYPIQSFPDWDDITSFPLGSTFTGLNSGAVLTATVAQPTLMNDSTISVMLYDNLKRAIQAAHAASVGVVPGRNESPVDAAFGFDDLSYAIHDCVMFTFTNGSGTTDVPLEGSVLIDQASGNLLGVVLDIVNLTGDWVSGNAAGTFVVYAYPIGQVFPGTGDRIDLYNATGTVLVKASIARFGSAAATDVDPSQTRALLYSTYDQYVKSYWFGLQYGQNIVNPPKRLTFTPPTWTRQRLTRELPYTCVGTSATNTGFGAVGTAKYSQYEYTRLGLTTDLTALSPITTADTFPTVATDISGLAQWVNQNNILVQDGAVATCTRGSGATTAYIRGTGFDFSAIPEGSTILGVQVRMRVSAGLVNSFKDFDVRLTSAAFPGGVGATNKAQGVPITAALVDYTYGGTNDQWGETALTDAVIRDPTFGFQARWIRFLGAGAQTVNVDAFAIQVTYVPPSRILYVRDPSATTVTDVAIKVLHYSVDKGTFAAQTAEGVLSVVIGATEAAGTAAGKIRRIGAGNEIRTAASTGANVANGNLLAYVTAEDYPVSFPPSLSLDNASSRYEVIDANFWDTPDGRAAYIVNGVENASMFDGTFHIRIRCGRPTAEDNPRHVAAHLGILHLGYASGSVVYTAFEHPLSFLDRPLLSGVYNFGEPITGLMTVNGATLGVWTDRATRGLQGNSPISSGGIGGYIPVMISPAINCIEYTLVNLVAEAVWCSYRGIETVRTTNAYADFETLPLSAAAQGWLQGRLQVDLSIGSRPSRALYAVGVRNKRQYRVYFEDGYCFTLTMFDAGDMPVCTIQQLYRPNATGAPAGANALPTNAGVIRHLHNSTRTDGKEVIFATWENQNATIVPAAGVGASIGPYFPYVARIDCGYCDDIMPFIPNWVEFNAIWAGFPSQAQNWGSMTLFLNAYGGTQIKYYTKTDFDGPIFDYTYYKDNTILVPDDPKVQIRILALPTVETKAYIPVPGRVLNTSIDAEGPCLKLLIDGTQDGGATLTPSVVPIRITHVAITSKPLYITQN